MDTSPHQSDFVNVNGIRLHYLNWGGDGPVLLFLAGLGCNAHIFDDFAPRFTDRFHAIALTRRGHGQSDHPATGYDVDTLTDDIRQFMDTLKIDQAILVGHSLAGIELFHFSALYPERVLGLIFLEAAYDYSSPEFKAMKEKNPLPSIIPQWPNDGLDTIEDYVATLKRLYPALAAIWGEVMDEQARHEVEISPAGKVVDKMSDDIGKAINDTLASYALEDSKVLAPALSIFVRSDSAYYVSQDYMTAEQQAQVVEFFDVVRLPWFRQSVERFRRNVPHATVVEIPRGHHYCFIKQQELIFDAMTKFLLRQ